MTVPIMSFRLLYLSGGCSVFTQVCPLCLLTRQPTTVPPLTHFPQLTNQRALLHLLGLSPIHARPAAFLFPLAFIHPCFSNKKRIRGRRAATMHFPAMVSVCLSYSITALSRSLLLHSMKLQTRTSQHPSAKSQWLIKLDSIIQRHH